MESKCKKLEKLKIKYCDCCEFINILRVIIIYRFYGKKKVNIGIGDKIILNYICVKYMKRMCNE